MRKILHIDDDQSTLIVVRSLLEKNGYQVFAAADAMQGVMMTRQHVPDLVIIDIMMPAGGGASVYTRLRTLIPTSHIPILFYSSCSQDEVAKLIPNPTNTTMLKKPAEADALLKSIAAMLG